ncbi:MAG: hypothetical protein ACKV19_17325 [Verrucomicrobiales bacterium]
MGTVGRVSEPRPIRLLNGHASSPTPTTSIDATTNRFTSPDWDIAHQAPKFLAAQGESSIPRGIACDYP